MPLTAHQILQSIDVGITPSENLKGFLVGNPLSSYYHNEEGFVSALYGHSLLKEEVYNKWVDECYRNEQAIIYSTKSEVLYVKAYMSAIDDDFYALDCPMTVSSMQLIQSNKRCLVNIFANQSTVGWLDLANFDEGCVLAVRRNKQHNGNNNERKDQMRVVGEIKNRIILGGD